jgi:hypothetical protein
MNIVAQVSLQTLVEALCLTIRLRVVGRAAAEFDFSKFEQLSPKMAGEDAVSI